jgi:hypothetical protein
MVHLVARSTCGGERPKSGEVALASLARQGALVKTANASGALIGEGETLAHGAGATTCGARAAVVKGSRCPRGG